MILSHEGNGDDEKWRLREGDRQLIFFIYYMMSSFRWGSCIMYHVYKIDGAIMVTRFDFGAVMYLLSAGPKIVWVCIKDT